MLIPEVLRKKLSYTTCEKTYKLGEYKSKLDASKNKDKIYAIILIIAVIYIILSQSRYSYYLLPSMSSGTSISQIAKVRDMAFLLTCVVSGFLFYWTSVEHKKCKSSYDFLRIDLIESSNENFCKCNNTCNCKEEYIKYMKAEGIDLIFK